jgi:hypothetical protein
VPGLPASPSQACHPLRASCPAWLATSAPPRRRHPAPCNLSFPSSSSSSESILACGRGQGVARGGLLTWAQQTWGSTRFLLLAPEISPHPRASGQLSVTLSWTWPRGFVVTSVLCGETEARGGEATCPLAGEWLSWDLNPGPGLHPFSSFHLLNLTLVQIACPRGSRWVRTFCCLQGDPGGMNTPAPPLSLLASAAPRHSGKGLRSLGSRCPQPSFSLSDDPSPLLR